ncbi:MAG: T9SS type A sorting domain-containing protein [Flavobacteriales bacterium]|nr:T9SS type A sorting domain-containing protein [Flavobacteriales bacterium]
MKTKALILSIFIFLFAINTRAQNGTVNTSFGYDGINIPDTVVIGDTIEFSCWVVNVGDDVLAENILLKAARYDANLGLVNIRTIGGQGPNFIYPDDSIQFVPGFLFEVVNSTNYLIGDNIVVIWPKADLPSGISQTNQYLYSNLHVLSNSSISSIPEKGNKKALSFYPQPANDKLHFAEDVKSIQIFNILGKSMGSFNIGESAIAISHIPDGLYLVKISTEKGGEKVQKLIIKH